MKRHHTHADTWLRHPAALRDPQRPARPGTPQVHIDQSPRALAQRRSLDAAFGAGAPRPVVQRVMTILRDGVPVQVGDDHRLQSNERLPYDKAKRAKIDQNFQEIREGVEAPRVGISNRPGLGYDASVFTLEDEREKHERVVPTSLPPGFEPLPYVPKEHPDYEASLARAALEKQRVQEARKPGAVKPHLDGVSGLFIPGGQERDKDGTPEKTTRQGYEEALVKEARNRGMPTLAVCGGSRAFGMAFGGSEQSLSGKVVKTHEQRTDSQAHGLTFPDRHTLIGGASPTLGALDSINSTHKKVMATTPQGGLSGVPDLPGTGRVIKRPQQSDLVVPKESELVVTARDSVHGTPEGFETRYGAPMMGITSHPEAIYRGSTDRTAATPSARNWSDNLFEGFDQSMRAYSGKQAVNEQISTQQARAERPHVYEKWRRKRNWQKLLQLGMITQAEAQEIQEEVAQHRQKKADYFHGGRPGREPSDPSY